MGLKTFQFALMSGDGEFQKLASGRKLGYLDGVRPSKGPNYAVALPKLSPGYSRVRRFPFLSWLLALRLLLYLFNK